MTMQKVLSFAMAAVAALCSCSGVDETPDMDGNTDMSAGGDVAIRLSSGVVNTRASIESADGLFAVDGLGLYALSKDTLGVGASVLPVSWSDGAEGVLTHNVLLDNVEANAVIGDDSSRTNIVFADGEERYYPYGSRYSYSFYGYYPRVEAIEATDTSRVAILTISGKEDVIYGTAVSDEPYAYSAYYFRMSGNSGVVPSMQFDHKLMRLTFSAVPTPDEEGGSTYIAAQDMGIESIKVLGVPTEGRLVIADLNNPANNGKLTFDWSDEDGMADFTLLDSDDAELDSDNYFMQVDDEGNPVELTVGQGVLLPVPESGTDHTYKVSVTLRDRGGNVYLCEHSQELRLSDGSSFEAGKSYNVRLFISAARAMDSSASLGEWDDADTPGVDLYY